jgi:hypothetical protein
MQKFLILLLACIAPQVSEARDMVATYSWYYLGKGTIDIQQESFDTDGRLAQWDEFTHALYCSKKSGFHCFVIDGEPLEFAVPRHPLKINESWRFHGRDYVVVTSLKVAIPGGPIPHTEYIQRHAVFMGLDESYVLIRSGKPDERHTLFFYSYPKGLIGYVGGGPDQKGVVSYGPISWLEQVDGLCSDAFEKNMGKSALFDDEAQLHFDHPLAKGEETNRYK